VLQGRLVFPNYSTKKASQFPDRLYKSGIVLIAIGILSQYSKSIQTKKAVPFGNGFIKVASTYSPTLKNAVPSALAGLTSLFGMGRGGPRCYRHLKLLNAEL
jgi:hypothetical protein